MFAGRGRGSERTAVDPRLRRGYSFAMEYAEPRIYDLELAGYEDDFPFYRRLAARAGGPILELACGTGRLAIPLALSGADVTGLDRSGGMLSLAKRKARRAGAEVRWVLGDMRHFALRGRFAAVFLPLNGVQHLLTAADLRRTLRCARSHLLPGGILALDVYNPDLAKLSREAYYRAWRYRRPRAKGLVSVWVRNRFNPRGVNTVEFEHRHRGKPVFRETLRLRCYFAGALDLALERAGFRLLKKLGGLDGRPFSPGSPLQVLVARRKLNRGPSMGF